MSHIRPRALFALLGGALALLALILIAGSAQAAIVAPAQGSVVSGDVTIVEDHRLFTCSYYPGGSSMTISVGQGSHVIQSWTTFAVQPAFVVEWRTEGRVADGEYWIRTRVVEPGLGWPCSSAPAGRYISTVNVTVRNAPNATILSLHAPPSAYWQETVEVSATLRDAATGSTLAGRNVVLSVGDEARLGVTDAHGVARATLDVDQLPAKLTARAEFGGERAHAPANASAILHVLARPTRLEYEGATDAIRGASAVLSARVVDDTPGSARRGEPLRDVEVTFLHGGLAVGARTSNAGLAAASTVMRDMYGHHAGLVTYAGAPGRLPALASFAYEIRWEHILVDAAGQGELRLNTVAGELQVAFPAETTAISSFSAARLHALAPAQLAVDGTPLAAQRLALAHVAEGLEVVAEFDPASGDFSAFARTDGGWSLLARHSPPAPPPVPQPELSWTPGRVDGP